MIIRKSLNIFVNLAVLSLLLLAPMLAKAQQISVSLPDTSAVSGDTLLVPLSVSTIDKTDEVVSGGFRFSLNENTARIIGIEKAGTLLENSGNVIYHATTQKLAFAGTDTLSGSGTLAYIRIAANTEADFYQSTDIHLEEAYFNEGEPAVLAENGSFKIKGITIQPRSSSTTVIEGESLQFNLSGDFEEPITWSVTNTDVAEINSEGLLSGKIPGMIQVKARDAQGLRDSTDYFRVQPLSLLSLEISVPDTAVRQTKTVELPVQISDVTGLGLLSAGMTVTYDDNDLELTDVRSTETLTEPWGTPTTNYSEGKVGIASAGTDTLAGDGILFTLVFTVQPDASGNSTISIQDLALNEDIEAEITEGTFTALAAPEIPVIPGDTTLSIGNTLQFEVSGGEGTLPYSWQISDETIASIDENSGYFEALGRGDVTVKAIDADGFPSSEINVRINNFDAFLDTVNVEYPDTAIVSLRTTQPLDAFGIISYQTEVSYDTTKLNFDEVITDGTLTEGLSIQVRDSSDYVRIAVAGTTPLTGSEPVLRLSFTSTENVSNGDHLPLTLRYLEFNEPAPSVPVTTPKAGAVIITRLQPSSLSAPLLTLPGNHAANINRAPSFEWQVVEDADEYVYQLSVENQFTTLLADTILTTSTFSHTELDYSTTYYWRVKAVNQEVESDWSDVFTFTTLPEDQISPGVVNPLGEIILNEDFGEMTIAVLDTVFNQPEGQVPDFQLTSYNADLHNATLTADTLKLSSKQDVFGSGQLIVKAVYPGMEEIFDTLSIQLLPVNDLPEFVNLPDSVNFRNDSEFTLQLDNYLSDAEESLFDLSVDVTTEPDLLIYDFDDEEFVVTLSAPGFVGEGLISLKITDSDGGIVEATVVVTVEISTSNNPTDGIPGSFSLRQNYPNPFNPTTVIGFDLPEAADVRLQVFDMLGRNVATLIDQHKSAGRYTVDFDASNLSTGIYIYRIETGSKVMSRKMMLVK